MTLFYILVSWFIIFIVHIGIGSLFTRLIRLPEKASTSIADFFWIGYGVTLLVLMMLNFFLPINLRVTLLMSFIGLVGFFSTKESLRQFRALLLIAKGHRAIFLTLSVLVLVYANFSRAQPWEFDFGFYHLQTIKWAAAYPTIPGIGNLHPNYAFNQTHFLWNALLGIGTGHSFFHHITSGPFVVALLLKFFPIWASITDKNFSHESLTLKELTTIFIIPVFFFLMTMVANPIAEVPLLCLQIYLISVFLELIDQATYIENAKFILFFTLMMSAVALTIKLSFLAFGLSLSLLSAVVYRRKTNFSLIVFIRQPEFYWPFTLGVLAVSMWVSRNILMSGYPLYPSYKISVDHIWTMPQEKVMSSYSWILSWARTPNVDWHIVLQDSKWFIPWFKRNLQRYEFIWAILAALAAFVQVLIYKKEKSNFSDHWKTFFLVQLVLLASFAYWFTTAPDMRLAIGLFWIQGGISTAFIAKARNISQKWIKTIVIVLSIPIMIYYPLRRKYLRSFMDFNADQKYPIPETTEFKTNNGLILYVPPQDGYCMDAKILCTKEPNEDLRLIVPGRIEKGFSRR